MSLLEDAKEVCVFISKQRVADGQGGYTTKWTEGEEFKRAIAYNNSTQAQIAQKQGLSSFYTVTTDKGIHLEYHEVFKRVSDGKVFRVTSDYDDMITPLKRSFSYEQVTAEEWSLV